MPPFVRHQHTASLPSMLPGPAVATGKHNELLQKSALHSYQVQHLHLLAGPAAAPESQDTVELASQPADRHVPAGSPAGRLHAPCPAHAARLAAQPSCISRSGCSSGRKRGFATWIVSRVPCSSCCRQPTVAAVSQLQGAACSAACTGASSA